MHATYKDQERLKHIKTLTGPSFVTAFYALTDNTDHERQQLLEGFLSVAMSVT